MTDDHPKDDSPDRGPSQAEELQQLVYAVSHDLQAPLRSARLALELLREAEAVELGSPQARYLGLAEEGVALAQRQLDGLLEYSRIVTHGWPFTTVELDACLAEAWKRVRGEWTAKTEQLDAAPLPQIQGDAKQLERMLVAVLDNALRHASHEPNVSIELRYRTEDGCAVLDILDNGPGLRSEDGDKLVALFARGREAARTAGTGAGLAIAHRIAKRHGGGLRLQERRDGTTGAHVEIRLPQETACT